MSIQENQGKSEERLGLEGMLRLWQVLGYSVGVMLLPHNTWRVEIESHDGWVCRKWLHLNSGRKASLQDAVDLIVKLIEEHREGVLAAYRKAAL